MKKVLAALAAVATGGTLVACGSAPETASTFTPQTLTAAGATFPAPLYQRWFNDYATSGGHKVSYQAVGSGAGVRQYVAGTVDFGASDGAIKDDKMPEQGVVQIPMTGGAIVPAYNVPGCDVKMTQTQLADVFLGKITNWSTFGCADGLIKVVYRSDGSGTTQGFTNSLSAFSEEWATKVGTGKAVKWPTGVGSKGNSGVAGSIKNTPGSIGYLNYGYVSGGKFQQVALQNKDGNYVTASAETSSAGLSKIILDDKLRGADANPSGENSYPIVSLTWILAYPEAKNNAAVKDTLRYMLSEEAQGLSDSLGYVPLPENLRQKSLAAVETLK